MKAKQYLTLGLGIVAGFGISVVGVSYASQNLVSNVKQVTPEVAKSIMLNKVPGANILEFSYDGDDKTPKYDGTLIKDNYEYEVDVNAKTGQIIKFEKEAIFTPNSNGNANNASANTQQSTTQNNNASTTRKDYIGESKAKSIMLNKVPGATISKFYLDNDATPEYDGELMDSVSKVLGKILKKLANVKKEDKVLVVGLGNWNVTPDALGPKVIEGIMVTRHLSQVMPEFMEEDMISVAAISPGVLGTTGIETVEVIKALVENIKPSLIICIDALAARRIERLNKTIQISDTGISPGAGVGNHRKAINKEELGVRVIAVGVPTVVDASTIANDTIDMVLDNLINEAEEGKEFYNMLKNVDKDAKKVLIREVLNPYVGDLIVTPKEVDLIIDSLSKIISNGINIATQPNMTMEDINKFMN